MNQSIKAAYLAAIGVLLAGCQALPTDSAMTASYATCPIFAIGPADFAPPYPADCQSMTQTASGVKYISIVEGDRDAGSPTLDDLITVHYEAFLADQGTLIDSSYLRGGASTYQMTDLIDGWAEALQLMVPGDEGLVFVPAAKAFGSEPVGETIPPHADIVYRVRLDGFVAAEPQGPDMAAWQAHFPWDPSRDAIQALPSGVSYIVLQYGVEEAPTAQESDRVLIHYEGRLADSGEIFDTSWSSRDPAQFSVGELIPGLTEVVTHMRAGDRFLVHVPADLAYGETGAGEAVPPDADLMFQIALLRIEPAE